MTIPRVLVKKATEYVQSFQPSLTVESHLLKTIIRKNIEDSLTEFSHEQLVVFNQLVVEGLQQLRDNVEKDEPTHESALDEIELKLLTIQNSEEQAHGLVFSTPSKELSGPLPIAKTLSSEEKKRIARTYLKFMSGANLRGEAIMTTREYDKILAYTDHLMIFNTVPTDIEQVRKINISNRHVTYTYYLIHWKLTSGTTINDVYIDFLMAVFSQLDEWTPAILKAKFSDKPNQYELLIKKA